MKNFYSHKTYLKVRDFILKKKLIKEQSKVIAAVSGGADSVFMLFCLLGLKKEFNFDLAVCHFNHMLRKEADSELKFVEELSRKLNLKFYSDRGDVEKYAREKGVSVEMAARVLRYNFFDRLLKEGKGDIIALAHNLTDSVETFFLNIERGTGIRGLKGISARNEQIIRPVLCLDKDEIRKTLESFNIEYKVDESNFDNKYKRNLVRNVLIKDLKSVFGVKFEKSFKSLFENVEASISAQGFFIENFLKDKAFIDENGARIKKDILLNLPDNVFFELMLFVFERVSGSTYKISKRLLEELFEWVKIQGSSKRALFSDKSFFAVKTKDYFYLVKKDFFDGFSFKLLLPGEYSIPLGYKFVVEKTHEFVLSSQNSFVILNKLFFNSSLNIGRIDFGKDYIVRKGKKVENLNRFLKKRGLSDFERKTAFVLKRENEVLFIPHVAVSETLKNIENSGDLIKVYMKDCLG